MIVVIQQHKYASIHHKYTCIYIYIFVLYILWMIELEKHYKINIISNKYLWCICWTFSNTRFSYRLDAGRCLGLQEAEVTRNLCIDIYHNGITVMEGGYPFVYGYICLSINLMVGINFITRNFGVTTLYYKWRTMRIDEDPSNGIPCWFGWGGQSLHVRELSIRNKVIIPGRNQNSFRFRRLILLVRDMMT